MTVVNMLSFGDSGAAIADEQVSYYFMPRKSNVANKLKIIDNYVLGGSGEGHFIENIYNRLEKTGFPKKYDFDFLGRELSQIVNSFINNYRDSSLHGRFGLSLSEIQTGNKILEKTNAPLDPEFKRTVADYLSMLNSEILPSTIVIGGINQEKFEIYFLGFVSCFLMKSPLPYVSIGSGSDEAGRILSHYIEQKSKKEREKIDPMEGFLKLIEATNQASLVNIGVGGIPSIVYVDKNGPKEVQEEKCILLSEIVKGHDFGQLEKDFVYSAIDGLVFGKAKFEDVEEQMKQKAKCWNTFEKRLRGYKN